MKLKIVRKKNNHNCFSPDSPPMRRSAGYTQNVQQPPTFVDLLLHIDLPWIGISNRVALVAVGQPLNCGRRRWNPCSTHTCSTFPAPEMVGRLSPAQSFTGRRWTVRGEAEQRQRGCDGEEAKEEQCRGAVRLGGFQLGFGRQLQNCHCNIRKKNFH